MKTSLSWATVLSLTCAVFGWLWIIAWRGDVLPESLLVAHAYVVPLFFALGTILGAWGVRRGDGGMALLGFVMGISLGCYFYTQTPALRALMRF